MGLFAAGEVLEVIVIAMALDADIPRLTGAITDHTTGTVKPVIPAPPAPNEKLTRGVPWVGRARYTV
jgi:hypothetical protein